MNNKLKLSLVAVGAAATLCACSNTDTYVPDPVASDWSTYNTVVLAHPGQHCVMEWGAGVYVSNCYPATAVIPYSVHIYYGAPGTRYCGCWSVAARPVNYRPVYVNKTTYQKTVINKQTNVTINKNPVRSNLKAPQDAVPKGYTPPKSSVGTKVVSVPRSSSGKR